MNPFEFTPRHRAKERATTVGFMLFVTAFFVVFALVSFLMALFAMSFYLMPFWTWAVGIGCFVAIILAIADFYNYGEVHICKTPHILPHPATQPRE